MPTPTALVLCARRSPAVLLIDRFAEGGPVVELFSRPENGVDGESRRIPFKEKIEVPDPVAFALDTAAFTADQA